MDGEIGSLWEAKTPPAQEALPLMGEVDAEVAIVGGGYSGLSTALHLARKGAAGEVVLLEAATPGFGASGRNNGQVIPTLTRGDPDDMVARLGPERGRRFAELVRDSAAITFDLIRQEGIACDAVQKGWVQPAHRPSRFRQQEGRVRQWQALGADVALMDAAELERRIGCEGYHGGWIAASGGHLNPLAYARGLAAAIARAGVRLHAQSPVQSIERRDGRWLLTTPEGRVSADQVVLATAAYTDALWPELARTVIPITAFQIATAPVGQNLRGAINPENLAVSDTRSDLRFFRYDRDHRLVSGGALFIRTGMRRRLEQLVAQRLTAIFPDLDAPRFDYSWNGLLAVNPERFPHLYELGPGLFSWIGCNGRGVALGTAMGKVLADLVTGADPSELPLPLERPAPLRNHALYRLGARVMLPVYRWRDGRD